MFSKVREIFYRIKTWFLYRKKIKEGYEFVEYLYDCSECDYVYWSDSKKLFKRCPKCFVKRMNNRMRLAL